MEIMKTIISILIDLALLAAIAIGTAKLFTSYTKAQIYHDMNQVERGILQIADKAQYEDLLGSYVFISNLPFIGETL